MVPADSCGVSRVPHYSGCPWSCLGFRLRAFHPLGSDFPFASPNLHSLVSGSYNPGGNASGLGYVRVRSPLLAESLSYFLFLRLLRCFTSPGFASLSLFDSGKNGRILIPPGYPIRKSPDHRVFAAPRSLSQLITSFIACQHQGIHCVPFIS
jgi:hypothetical protein